MQVIQYSQNKYQNNLLQNNNNANNNNLNVSNQLAMPLYNFQSWCRWKNIVNGNQLSQQQKMQVILAYKQYIMMAMKYNQELNLFQHKLVEKQQEQLNLQQKQQKINLKNKRRNRPPVPKFSEDVSTNTQNNNEMTFEAPQFAENKSINIVNNNNVKIEEDVEEQSLGLELNFEVKQEANSFDNAEESTDASSGCASSSNSQEIDIEGREKFGQKLQILLENIEELLQSMNIKDQELYRKSVMISQKVMEKDTNILKNRSAQTIAAALIIHASRMVGSPLTTRKVAKFIDCKERTLNKIFNLLKSNFEELSESQRPNPSMFINKIVKNLSIQNNLAIMHGVNFFVKQLENLHQIQGQQAGTIAAVGVKISCHLNGKDFSFKEISDASDVCQISLRHCYSVFLQNKDLILSQQECPKNFMVDPKFLPKHSSSNNTNQQFVYTN